MFFWNTTTGTANWRRGQASLGAGYAPNTAAEVLIVATRTRVDIRAKQVQAVAIADIVRSRRPIVAVATPTARRRRSEVAGVEEVIRITSPGLGLGSTGCTGLSCACTT